MVTIQQILSTTAIVISLVLFSIGWPVQVYKNFKRKSTQGLSFPLFLVSVATNTVWLCYGFGTGILMLIIPNIVGVIIGCVILIQFFIYRKKHLGVLSLALPLFSKLGLTPILGVIGIALNWILAGVGFPHQIYENFKRKSTEGLSAWNFVLWFTAFSINEAYGISIKNRPLIWGNIPAIVLLGIILAQMIYYRNKGPITI